MSIILGNKLVRIFPKGFIEEDSIFSGIVGFVGYLIIIVSLVAFFMM